MFRYTHYGNPRRMFNSMSVVVYVNETRTGRAVNAPRAPQQLFGIESEAKVWDDLDEGFTGVLQRAYGDLQIPDSHQINITINGYRSNGEEFTFHVNRVGHDPDGAAFEITQQLMKYTESQQYMQLRFRMTVSAFPRRQEDVFNLQGRQGHRRTVFKGDYREFVQRKKGVVVVLPETDQTGLPTSCFYQWMVISTCYLLYKKHIRDVDYPWIQHIGLLASHYKECTSAGNKFTIRRQLTERFCDFFGVPPNPVETRSEVSEWESRLGFRFVLFGFVSGVRVIYPTHLVYSNTAFAPFMQFKPYLVGVVSEVQEVNDPERLHLTHVDVVTNITSMYPDSNSNGVRWCWRCHAFYSRKRRSCGEPRCCSMVKEYGYVCGGCHLCDAACTSCGGTDCELTRTDQQVKERCVRCRHEIYGPVCKERHDTEKCRSVIRATCEACKRNQHPGLECDEYRCLQCFGTYRKSATGEVIPHECFLKRTRMREAHERLAVYDFECAISCDGTFTHVPYLITCWFPYGHALAEQMCETFRSYCWQDSLFDASEPMFVFWGDEGIEAFFDLVRSPFSEKYDFFAHNGRSYDHIFIKKYLSHKYQLFSKDIRRGQKYIQITYPSLKVTFKDSLCFLTSSLRNLGHDFRVEEVAKGHFPHRLMTTTFLKTCEETGQFDIPFPDRSYFETDFGTSSRDMAHKREAEEWLNEQCSHDPPLIWNVKAEAIRYCVSDTLLLGEVLKRFRTETMMLTSPENTPRPSDLPKDKIRVLDPLQYVTLPSSIMSFYLSQLLPEDTIGVLDRYYSICNRTREEWYLYQSVRYGIPLDVSKEVAPHENWIIAEGRCFVLCTCYSQGCRSCYNPNVKNTRFGKTFGELWTHTQAKLRRQYALGYEVVCQWECEWTRMKETDPTVQAFFNEYRDVIEERTPLDLREAYKGGKSELYKHVVNDEICMVDFVSQYPTALMGESVDPMKVGEEHILRWPMPTGTHHVILRPERYQLQPDVLGVAKVRVLPPRQLYAPFLSMRVPSRICTNSYEVLFGLCRICMETRNDTPCRHTDENRSFVGTWTLTELNYAVSLGYRIIKYMEVWEYPSSSTDLFRSFVIPFMSQKILCKRGGIVDNHGEFTDEGKQVAEYVSGMSGQVVTPSDFEDNPARRTVAKMILNAFTGKWGQKDRYENFTTFYLSDVNKFHQLVQDNNLEITYLEILDDHGSAMAVNYITRMGATQTHFRKNDLIVAHITAYGRMMLHKVEHRIAQGMIYVDTDSAYHIRAPEYLAMYNTGFRTGDLELELKQGFGWRGIGRKSYVYHKTSDEIVCRQKGVRINLSNMSAFTPENVLRLIETSRTISRRVIEEDSQECDGEERELSTLDHRKRQKGLPSIDVEQRQFITEKIRGTTRLEKRTVTRIKKTVFRVYAPKRRICWPQQLNNVHVVDTLPYGYS